MQLRRSQLEQDKRAGSREELAKKVASAFTHDPFSARILTAKEEMDDKKEEDKKEEKKEASIEEKTLANQAIRFTAAAFKDAGLHSVHFRPFADVTVSDSVKGLRWNVIKTASVKVTATTPVAANKRIADKPFFINLSYDNGKFSVDSLEKNSQTFPVTKGSLSRIAAMDDEAKEPLKSEEHEDEDANVDVKNASKEGK